MRVRSISLTCSLAALLVGCAAVRPAADGEAPKRCRAAVANPLRCEPADRWERAAPPPMPKE